MPTNDESPPTCSMCCEPIAFGQTFQKVGRRLYHTTNSIRDPDDPDDSDDTGMTTSCYRWMVLYAEVKRRLLAGD